MNSAKFKISVIIFVMVLSGCSHVVPITTNFPGVPTELMKPPSKLLPLSNAHNLSDILDNANTNYGTYYIVSEKLILWQEWYTKQQEIYNNIKE